jgi:hypothetical protein
MLRVSSCRGFAGRILLASNGAFSPDELTGFMDKVVDKNRKYLPKYAFEHLQLADSELASGRALVAAGIRLENAVKNTTKQLGNRSKQCRFTVEFLFPKLLLINFMTILQFF